ncbi:AraC family transcriptional regulator [Neobacillus mesonae]|nr:AraC family transcriptional regulator [Neobacillus mesonae]
MSNTNHFLANAHRLPVLDWNVNFFGAHSQSVQSGWHVPSDSHSAFEIIYVLSGSQHTSFDHGLYHVQKGDVLIIPPGFVHEILCNSTEGMTYFCAHFKLDDPEFVMDMIQRCDIYYKNGSIENEKLQNILIKWINIIHSSDNESSFYIKMHIQIVLSELLLTLHTITNTIDVVIQRANINTSLYAKEIAERIKSAFKKQGLQPEYYELTETLHIENIMRSIGLSPGYGYEVFKNVYGISPRQYLSQLKLKEGKALIKETDLSIQTISKRLGYKNVSHFSRQFKRWMGVSPLQYRNEPL